MPTNNCKLSAGNHTNTWRCSTDLAHILIRDVEASVVCLVRCLDDDQSDEFLKLEDITHRYRKPCILDVKVS